MAASNADKRTFRSLIGWALLSLLIGAGLAAFITWPGETLNTETESGCAYFAPKDNRCACLTELHRQHPEITREDMRRAEIAWRYFENNYQPATGLVNSVDQYPSTTMWDSGSVIFGTITARRLCLISDTEFHQRTTKMLGTLNRIKLFDGVAPNKVYNTQTAEMTDYNNNPAPDGIGVSAIDLARMISALQTLSDNFPAFAPQASRVIGRWNFSPIVKQGQAFGLYRDPVLEETLSFQEGRLGYEQYAGKIFLSVGLPAQKAADWKAFRQDVIIDGVPIAVDSRDPREFGAYNYVVTESYALEAMELPPEQEFEKLLQNIFLVQKKHAQKTGLVTAVSEDNLDRPPYFLYNTIYVAGRPWSAITDTGVPHPELKTISVKAALSLAHLFPKDDYSPRLIHAVEYAYDPERGWYSGIYDSGIGFNEAITGNTNGIILETLLHKMGLVRISGPGRKAFNEAVRQAITQRMEQ